MFQPGQRVHHRDLEAQLATVKTTPDGGFVKVEWDDLPGRDLSIKETLLRPHPEPKPMFHGPEEITVTMTLNLAEWRELSAALADREKKTWHIIGRARMMSTKRQAQKAHEMALKTCQRVNEQLFKADIR